MNKYASKLQDSKRQSDANVVSKSHTDSKPAFQFVDNRPEAIQMRKLQEMVQNSAQVMQLKIYQENVSHQNNLVIQGNGLRYRGSDPEILEQTGHDYPTYTIEVRARPVQGLLGAVATHCYIALLDKEGGIKDTLSFDPSNSIGSTDANPTDFSRDRVVVGTGQSISAWNQLKSSYSSFASKLYDLQYHNCCHAVMASLVASNLPDATKGISLAREANNTWDKANQILDANNFIKKNQ